MLKNKENKLMALVFILTVFFIGQQAPAQNLDLPQASPAVKTVGTIGITKVAVKYNSPQVRGREIWGKLVPYGLTNLGFGSGNPAPWRAGANQNTVIYFSTDVEIEGNPLKAGSYGFFLIPGENQWTAVFSKNSSSWGSYYYNQSEDALRVKAKTTKAEHMEWLTYGFDNFKADSADVYLHWEKLKISFNVKTDTDTLVLQSIKDQLRGQVGFSWQSYNQAAFYYLGANKHLDQAEKFARQSISMNKTAQNQNILAYVLMAQNKTDEALKLFHQNIKDYPDDWNALDSLGENLIKAGNKKEGIKYYKLALKKAPDSQKKRIQGVLDNLKK